MRVVLGRAGEGVLLLVVVLVERGSGVGGDVDGSDGRGLRCRWRGMQPSMLMTRTRIRCVENRPSCESFQGCCAACVWM